MRLRGGTETVSRRIPFITCKKTKFMASKKTSSNSVAPPSPSSQTLPKPGLEAGLNIKLNHVSGVGGEGRDQATR